MIPLLTISVPTYQRVDLLEHCLASIVPAEPATWGMIELVVNDNSPGPETEALVARFTASWPSPARYYRNPAGTGAIRNFNHCIERAKGRYHLILHDDDYLLPGALDGIVRRLQAADHAGDKVLLFGVDVVDLSGKVIRHQGFRHGRFLPPAAALRRLLAESSFVRVPGLIVQNAAYHAVGGFRASAGTTVDFDMSIRLFSRFGVRCLAETAAAYTTHPDGVTSSVFTPLTIALNLQNFELARGTALLSAATVGRLQRRWFHQFILAGTWRALKEHDRSAARQAYALFDLPGIRMQGISLRWLPVRVGFAVLSGALWRRALVAGPDAEGTGQQRNGGALTREW